MKLDTKYIPKILIFLENPMKKKILAVIIFLSILLLSAHELNDKQKQLEDLNQLIKKEKMIIQKAELEKAKTQQNMLSTKKEKTAVEKKISILRNREKKTKKELDQLLNSLHLRTSEYEKINYYLENELTQLTITHYQSQLFPEKEIDCRFLATLIKRTAEEFILIKDRIGEIKYQKDRKNKQYENVIWSRIVEKKKNDRITDELTFLNQNITKYEQQKQKASRRKKRLEKEAIALDELITRLQSEIVSDEFSYKFSTSKLIWPLKGKVIRDFGEQKSDRYHVSIFNDGIDIQSAEGKEVVAVENGVIAYARWYNGAGKLVIIDHKNGFYSLYSHNSKILVSKGDNVQKNQPIALSGKTGSADQPCLHFELRKRGTPVNPLEYLE